MGNWSEEPGREPGCDATGGECEFDDVERDEEEWVGEANGEAGFGDEELGETGAGVFFAESAGEEGVQKEWVGGE